MIASGNVAEFNLMHFILITIYHLASPATHFGRVFRSFIYWNLIWCEGIVKKEAASLMIRSINFALGHAKSALLQCGIDGGDPGASSSKSHVIVYFEWVNALWVAQAGYSRAIRKFMAVANIQLCARWRKWAWGELPVIVDCVETGRGEENKRWPTIKFEIIIIVNYKAMWRRHLASLLVDRRRLPVVRPMLVDVHCVHSENG